MQDQSLNKKLKILYICPETFGDVLISTGVVNSIKKKYPNSKIFFATQKKHFPILEGNKDIAGVIDYHQSMDNYRFMENWGPVGTNPFDISYKPYIITQRIPDWIKGGYGPWLGQAYANMCDVPFGEMFLEEDDSISKDLPEEYITVQSQTRTDPKDWDHWENVLEKIKDIPIVHVGAAEDKEIKCNIDLRGKTTIQQVASIVKKSKLHLGGDSFLMHIAGLKGTPSVIVFGGTYKKQGYAPSYSPHVRAIETQDRGLCHTSCHLLECESKKHGLDKCINNIPVEQVLHECSQILGEEYVEKLDPITISSYLIIRNGIKYNFPYQKAIAAALAVSDEVVVVDGGSTDGTWENLQEMAKINKTLDNKERLKIHQHEWDMNCPTLFGDEKTYARELCTGTHLIQLDCDEIISEPYEGAIRQLIERNRFDDVLDLPCINFYGDNDTIRIEDNVWKWRISKNTHNILHGVHKQARQLDPETAQITMDKRVSDSCLPAGQKIFTLNGLMPIEDIKCGHYVLGHSGEPKMVSHLGQREVNCDLYTIKAHGFSVPIKLTDNHKILVSRWGKLHWVEASLLDENDNLVFILPNGNVETKTYDMQDFIHTTLIKNGKYKIHDNNTISNASSTLNKLINLDVNFSWLLGTFCRYGKIIRKSKIVFRHKNQQLIEDIASKFSQIFGDIKISINQNKRSDKFVLSINTKPVVFLLNKICYDKNGDKKIPNSVLFNISENIRNEFLNGFTNRKTKEEHITHYIDSPTLSYELFMLYGLEGKQPEMKIRKKAFLRSIGDKKYEMKELWRVSTHTDKISNLGNMLIAQIKNLSKKSFSGIVYNFEVRADHSYATHGFHVKNCEYIYEDTLEVCKHKFAFDNKLLTAHAQLKRGLLPKEEYIQLLEEVIKKDPVVFHYSWQNLDRKLANGEFWNETFHGKKEVTHNTTQNISKRIELKDREMLIPISFDHPGRKFDGQ